MFDIATISPDGRFICFYYMEDKYNYDPPVQVFVYKIGKIKRHGKMIKKKSFVTDSTKDISSDII